MKHTLTLLILLALLIPACQPQPGKRQLKVVASTALIGAIVQTVGDGKVQVTTIAPAGMCPGHFDLQPQSIAAAQEAQLLLYHGWEGWMDKLKEEIKNPAGNWIVVQTRGNWMVPPVQKKATNELTALLIKTAPADSAFFEKNRQRYLLQIDSVASVLNTMFADKNLPRVLASEHQAEFLRWLGFRVVGTYERAEQFTAQELSRLARVMVDSAVGLVVDNLQSGPDAGKPLAEAAGVRHVTLSNFPLEGDYLKTVLENGNRLLKVIE